jgi:hypothetical protein
VYLVRFHKHRPWGALAILVAIAELVVTGAIYCFASASVAGFFL